MIDDHMRFKVYDKSQHPYNHALQEMSYSNPALPGGSVKNAGQAMDWILAVLYPQSMPAVANVAALPAVGNTLNDYRVVQDNGVDGKAASYRWEQREGEASASWHKIYDMDWGSDSILEAFYNKTQQSYMSKFGYDDIDGSGAALTGDRAGQTLFGGKSAGTNLTFYPNAGDGSGAVTGFLQVAACLRPLGTGTIDLGQVGRAYRTGYFGTSVVAGTMTVSGGHVADTSGAVDFAALNLTTTGWWKAAQFLSSDGLAAAPALGLQSEATGFFKQAAGVLGLARAGVEAYRFGGQFLTPAGLVGGPAWSFLADPATGVYQPGASQWAVATGGVGRLLVDGSGNLSLTGGKGYWDAVNYRWGIGGTPLVDLHVQRASSPAMRLDSQEATGSAPGEFQFFAAGAANANLAALADMGYLDWYGRVSGATIWLAGIQGRYRGSGTTSFADLIFVTANGGAPAERMRLRYDGNLGVGVADPLYPLHVSGAAAAANFLLSGNTLSATDANGGIAIVPNGTGRVTVGVGLDPSADGTINLGQASTRWASLYLATGISDGTNSVAVGVLTSLRGINVGVAPGNSIFWNGTNWVAADPDAETFHHLLSDLTTGGTDNDSGHHQFAVLAGRAAGQTLYGSTGASGNFLIDSTSNVTKGAVQFGSKITGAADATQDLGAAATRWANLYLSGQAIGLRVENYTTAGRPAAAAGTSGRLYWDTTLLQLMVDQGGTWARASVQSYRYPDSVGWTGAVTTVTYTVPAANFSDTKTGLWGLQDNANNYKQILCDISFPAANQVTVSVDIALAASTYTLVGVG